MGGTVPLAYHEAFWAAVAAARSSTSSTASTTHAWRPPGGGLTACMCTATWTTGAVRAVESITTGLQWRAVRPPVAVTGPPTK
jgi:hypothetical protein